MDLRPQQVQLQLGGFSLNFILGPFTKICLATPGLVKIRQTVLFMQMWACFIKLAAMYVAQQYRGCIVMLQWQLLQYLLHLFIITNTMHMIGVDKIALFKTTWNNVLSPTCFDPHWIIIREVYTLFAKLLHRLINWKGDLVACQCCSGYVSLTRFMSADIASRIRYRPPWWWSNEDRNM